jgi:Outer membrane lipoprotein
MGGARQLFFKSESVITSERYVMRRISLMAFVVVAFLLAGAMVARAQGVGRGPVPETVRDTEMERDSLHNLEVARHYFRQKKAYRAALARCEEVIAGNPNFSRLDEVLYIAGMSSLRLSENRGRQAPTLPAEKLREDARDYLSRIVNEFPDSSFRERAENELRPLGGAKPRQ